MMHGFFRAPLILAVACSAPISGGCTTTGSETELWYAALKPFGSPPLYVGSDASTAYFERPVWWGSLRRTRYEQPRDQLNLPREFLRDGGEPYGIRHEMLSPPDTVRLGGVDIGSLHDPDAPPFDPATADPVGVRN